jgi:undecaprenyl-phosphate galactose phosphotransferase
VSAGHEGSLRDHAHPDQEQTLGVLLLPGIDVLTVLICFLAGGQISLSYANLTEERGLLLLMLATGCIVFFQQMGHYSRHRQSWQETGDVVVAVLIALAIDTGLLHLFKLHPSGTAVAISWGLVAVAIPSARFFAKRIGRALGGWRRSTVIIGTGSIALEAANAYASDSHLGYDVVAFIDPDAPPWSSRELVISKKRLPVQPLDPNSRMLPAWLGRPHVVIALELDELMALGTLIENLASEYSNLDIIPPIRGLPIHNAETSYFFAHDFLLIRTHSKLTRHKSQLMKRGFDLVMASAILVFLAPLLTLIACLLWRDGQPIFSADTKVGRDGQLFKCLKLRRMGPDATEVLTALLDRNQFARAEWERKCKLTNDPRITPLGHFLRVSGLDEAPQLWNVIKGEMSLVGPKPVAPDELGRFSDSKNYYFRLHPGFTGLWKINGRNDLDDEKRACLNNWYIRNWTLWHDIFILCKTV